MHKSKRQRTNLETNESFVFDKYQIEDVFVWIFSFLDIQQIIRCSRVCKTWHRFACNPLLKKIWARKFGVVLKEVPSTFYSTGQQIILGLQAKVIEFQRQLSTRPLHFRCKY